MLIYWSGFRYKVNETMYRKGKLRIVTPPCETADEDGHCDHTGVHFHSVHDSASGTEGTAGTVFLPHSCDEWVIGGRAEIEALIADLQEALAYGTHD
jgi:hypothetical protein